MHDFNLKQFGVIALITSVWVNASEVFRYFVFVRPRIKAFFDYKEGIAEMDFSIFSIWGMWDTLLTAILVFVFFLHAKTFGNNLKSVVLSGVLVWLAVFVIFWIATTNMGLSDWNMLLIILPLCLFEMIIGSWIVSKLYSSGRWCN